MDHEEKRTPQEGGYLQDEGAGTSGGPAHERQGVSTKTLAEIYAELTSSNEEAKQGSLLLTKDFMRSRDRELLRVKKMELDTQIAIYNGEYSSLDMNQQTERNRAILEAQKRDMQAYEQQFKKFFEDAAKMDNDIKQVYADVDELTSMCNKLTEQRAGITSDYLRVASTIELRNKKAEKESVYLEYLRKYLQINQEFLTVDALSQLSKQKNEVEKIEAEFEKLLKDEIAKKEKNSPPPPPPSPKEKSDKDQAQGGSASNSEIEALNRKLEALQNERQKERDSAQRQINSLQRKLEDRSQSSEISYDEIDDEMVGHQNEGQEENTGLTKLKIDTIQLPIFDGNFDEWNSFRDMFESLVNKSPKIAKVVKFYELRSRLRGPALETIKGYQLTSSNYDSAWSDLKKRFDHTEETVEDYIRKFLEVPIIERRANYTSLRSIVDATNQMLRALPSAGVQVSQWDPFINLIIKSKLDDFTRSEWRQKNPSDKLASTTDLIDFLENKSIELRPGTGERLSHMLRGEVKKNSPKKIFQVNEKKQEKSSHNDKRCPVCKSTHFIQECFKFKKLTAKERSNLIKKLKLCFKCLFNHSYKLCKKACHHCSGPHHGLLCFKKEGEARGEQTQAQQQIHSEREEKWNQPSTSKN